MNKFELMAEFVDKSEGKYFISPVYQSSKGFYAREDFIGDMGRYCLPLNKPKVRRGLALIEPVKYKPKFILCKFHNLQYYDITEKEFDELKNFCIKKHSNMKYFEILVDENGTHLAHVSTEYCSYLYYMYKTHKTKNILLYLTNIYGELPSTIQYKGYKSIYNNLINTVKGTPYEGLSYNFISSKICANMDNLYSIPAIKSDEEKKQYLLDNDYDFIDEPTVDLINDMIDDNILEVRFISLSDILFLYVDTNKIESLFEKYSLDDIKKVQEVNYKIFNKYNYIFRDFRF